MNIQKVGLMACGCLFVEAGALIGFTVLAKELVKTPIDTSAAICYGGFCAVISKPVQRIIDSLLGDNKKESSNRDKAVRGLIRIAGPFFAAAACSWAITKKITSQEFSYEESLALSGACAGLHAGLHAVVFIGICCIKQSDCIQKIDALRNFFSRDELSDLEKGGAPSQEFSKKLPITSMDQPTIEGIDLNQLAAQPTTVS